MNKERIKSLMLMLLVAMSFVLTTQIWFNISIEGLFVMSPKHQRSEAQYLYNKENLLKPKTLVVHMGENHTLLFNNEEDKDYYTSVLNGSKDVLRDWLSRYESYGATKLPFEQIHDIRNDRTVELIFHDTMEFTDLISLLNVDKKLWNNEIINIKSIIIDPFKGRLYLVDERKGSIDEYQSPNMPGALSRAITEIEKNNYNDFEYVFLNVFNETYYEYGDFAIAPLSITTMPALKVEEEVKADTELTREILEFFEDEDRSSISSMKDEEGRVTFTDRKEEAVTVDIDGTLEYYKYNVASDNVKDIIDAKEALDIATEFVNNHLGFTYDFYLSSIESRMQGGRTSYVISFDYKYNGIPIITESDTGSSAIEVEILGQEVKRYKRNVRLIEEEGQTINIKGFTEIVDIVWGSLDSHTNTKKSEYIVAVNDLYLAYIERNKALIPVWVVDVKVEDNESKQYDKKYMIGAEEGEIGIIYDEQ